MRDIYRLQVAYPGLTDISLPKSGRVRVEGWVVLTSDCGLRTPIYLAIDFPDSYPADEPLVYDAKGRFEHIPRRHFYADGRMCLWHPKDTAWCPEDPEAIIRFLDHVI